MGGWEQLGVSLMRAMTYLVIALSSFAAMTLITAAAPGFIRRERNVARQGMRRCFLWGLVFVINSVLVAALARLDNGILGNSVALVVMVTLLVIALSGLAAIATEVGFRVLAEADKHGPSTLACLTCGTIVLFVVAVIPVLGWLLFASALMTGIGAFLETAVQDYRLPRKAVPAQQPALNPDS